MQNIPNKYLNAPETKYKRTNPQTEIDKLTAGIVPLARSELPSGADGFCMTATRTGGYANDMDSRRQHFVKYHEVSHALGTHSEYTADCEAAARSGQYQFIRTPIESSSEINI
ncbi:MAG: hypothetical protein ABIG28_01145 [archaeon]